MARSEKAHFLIDSCPASGNARAQHNERRRHIQCRYSCLAQRMARGKILAVAKNRSQRFWHWPKRHFTTDKILVDLKALAAPPRSRPRNIIRLSL
jgi:hypothetical protein